jgi:sugar fermentation stimulation protein A
VGSLGTAQFRRGVYVYVGSAQRGIEQRVGRHRSGNKKLRWHIDYFLRKADVAAVIAVPSPSKQMECKLADAIRSIRGAEIPMRGFGSSDCRCESHLVFLGEEDLEPVTETLVYHLSTLGCVYPERAAPPRKVGREGQ